MRQIEKRDLLEPQGLQERIDTLLQMVEDGESFEIVDQGRVIALLTPPHSTEQTDEEDNDDPAWEHLKQLSAELSAHWPAGISVADAINDMRSEEQAGLNQSHEQELKDFWARIDALAAQIAEHSPAQVDAVEIVREGRRDL